MIFVCKLCGKEHIAVLPTPPSFSSEEIAQRKQAWLTAEAKLAKSTTEQAYEQNEKVYFKAGFDYFATMSNGVPQLPNTITSIKKGGEHIFLCSDHEEAKQKEPKAT